jgi:hypothetical protein
MDDPAIVPFGSVPPTEIVEVVGVDVGCEPSQQARPLKVR